MFLRTLIFYKTQFSVYFSFSLCSSNANAPFWIPIHIVIPERPTECAVFNVIAGSLNLHFHLSLIVLKYSHYSLIAKLNILTTVMVEY